MHGKLKLMTGIFFIRVINEEICEQHLSGFGRTSLNVFPIYCSAQEKEPKRNCPETVFLYLYICITLPSYRNSIFLCVTCSAAAKI